MIPFASQRGNGQDLAIHLMNTHDNEQMEISHLRGAVAGDLNGAFAEWELQAKALTKCKNYLYSLSINPDPEQGPLTREQYEDYIRRVEEKLGLADQPRAVVFHTKNGREHAHVVWSRIDAEAGKAVQLAFDREKLMMVTREFARDYGLTLPQGYDREGRDPGERGHDQLSLYEKAQQEKTGITKEERMAEITEAWRHSDSPQAFVAVMEECGYILATGKRPYVLVDLYGEVNALPKLINDKSVRAKDIQAFLGKDYPIESLPTVEEAKKLAAQHRRAREAFVKSHRDGNALKDLKEKQAARRDTVQKEAAVVKAKQAADQIKIASRQQAEFRALEGFFKDEMERISRQREAGRPTGLAAFLGRITGMNLVIKKLQERNDGVRTKAHEQKKKELHDRHNKEKEELTFVHKMQSLAQDRRRRALDRLDQRELNSLKTKMLRDERTQERDGLPHLPTLDKQGGKKEIGKGRKDSHYVDIQDHFTRSASKDEDKGGRSGDGAGGDYRSVFNKGKKIIKTGKDKDTDKGR